MSKKELRTAYFEEQLRASGLKVTPARLQVLLVLDTTKKPLSVQRIKKTLPTLDPVTIYRTLESLKKVRLAKQIDWQHGHAHFELAELGDHHHLVCTKCHRVEDIEDCHVEEISKTLLKKKSFAQITDHSLEFFGICQKCFV